MSGIQFSASLADHEDRKGRDDASVVGDETRIVLTNGDREMLRLRTTSAKKAELEKRVRETRLKLLQLKLAQKAREVSSLRKDAASRNSMSSLSLKVSSTHLQNSDDVQRMVPLSTNIAQRAPMSKLDKEKSRISLAIGASSLDGCNGQSLPEVLDVDASTLSAVLHKQVCVGATKVCGSVEDSRRDVINLGSDAESDVDRNSQETSTSCTSLSEYSFDVTMEASQACKKRKTRSGTRACFASAANSGDVSNARTGWGYGASKAGLIASSSGVELSPVDDASGRDTCSDTSSSEVASHTSGTHLNETDDRLSTFAQEQQSDHGGEKNVTSRTRLLDFTVDISDASAPNITKQGMSQESESACIEDAILVETNSEDVLNIKRAKRRWRREVYQWNLRAAAVSMDKERAEKMQKKIARRAKRIADKLALKLREAEEAAEEAQKRKEELGALTKNSSSANTEYFFKRIRELQQSQNMKRVVVHEHKSLTDRAHAAGRFIEATDWKLPLFLDSMNDQMTGVLIAHPERFFVLEPASGGRSRLLFSSPGRQGGVRLDDLESFLHQRFRSTE